MNTDIKDVEAAMEYDNFMKHTEAVKVDSVKDLEEALQADEELIDLKNTDPMVIMKLAAEGMGIVLNDPKPNCKKCHGRGYLGRKADTGEPIPCTCIYPKETRQAGGPVIYRPRNRRERRHGI
jgi:hypothetical protein